MRDVEFTPKPRNRGHQSMKPHPHHVRRLEEIERCRTEGATLIGRMTEREFLILGAALYAGEGSKTDGDLRFANSDPRMIVVFVTWLRHFFDIDESRLRLRLYLHEDLDVDAAVAFWSDVTGIPPTQFVKPYRAAADRTIRRKRHVHGCPAVNYRSTAIHRRVMGMVAAILSTSALPG